MNFDMLKDELFDFLNENTRLDVADIDVDDVNNIIIITASDGSAFEIECRQIS